MKVDGAIPCDQTMHEQLAAVESTIVARAQRGEASCPSFHSQLVARRSKRLRSLLLFFAARSGPHQTTPRLVSAAAGLELLHEATLYHDDIVDEAAWRRDLPSTSDLCGAAVAALAGSELLYATAELFADLPASLRRSIGRTGDLLCRGQLEEIECVGDVTASAAARIRVMRNKTASLFALAARIGATLGGAPEETVRRAARFGTWFGLCFQLVDDLRDLVSDRETAGRPPHADLVDGVYTLPVLYALAAPNQAAQLLACLEVLRRRTRPAFVARAVELTREAGGIARSAEQLAEWANAAHCVAAGSEQRADSLARALAPMMDHLHAELVTWRTHSVRHEVGALRREGTECV